MLLKPYVLLQNKNIKLQLFLHSFTTKCFDFNLFKVFKMGKARLK